MYVGLKAWMMKHSIKFVAMLTVAAAILCNCSTHEEEVLCGGCSLPSYPYSLYLSFQDVSGNDLLKELEFLVWDGINAMYNIGREEDGRGIIDPDLYTLEVVFPDKIAKFWNHEKLLYLSKEWKSELRFGIKNNYDILEFDTYSPRNLPFAEKITYKLNYSCLFGDNLTHEIVSYWKFIKTDNKEGIKVLCYRIEFEGKEFTQITYDSNSISVATIILDSK